MWIRCFLQLSSIGNVLSTHPELLRWNSNYQKFNYKKFIGYQGEPLHVQELSRSIMHTRKIQRRKRNIFKMRTRTQSAQFNSFSSIIHNLSIKSKKSMKRKKFHQSATFSRPNNNPLALYSRQNKNNSQLPPVGRGKRYVPFLLS